MLSSEGRLLIDSMEVAWVPLKFPEVNSMAVYETIVSGLSTIFGSGLTSTVQF